MSFYLSKEKIHQLTPGKAIIASAGTKYCIRLRFMLSTIKPKINPGIALMVSPMIINIPNSPLEGNELYMIMLIMIPTIGRLICSLALVKKTGTNRSQY